MKVVVVTKERRLHFFTAYAPQTGCSEDVKGEFWTLLHEKTAEIPSEEMVVVAGDLNGHVGISKDGFERHFEVSATEYETRTWKHEVADRPCAYEKKAIRRDDKLVTDAKVMPYEMVATQHRPLICTMKIIPLKGEWVERCGHSRIKWWRIKGNEASMIARIQMSSIVSVEEAWQPMKTATYEAARAQLGLTKPGRRRIDKQTWLWTDKVKEKV
ncbi:unnamed protein product [Nippostrongylus brasiliensis]|uniref:Endo/exonuclease/phosphatase domain-containing protein n=1 Tax=Nippostrongylus brasiliensis TaxID=27835 RepID=A0A0N4XXH9_NIPBR|nr:unnamed protein product [Nippostrongylus brasiliensis]